MEQRQPPSGRARQDRPSRFLSNAKFVQSDLRDDEKLHKRLHSGFRLVPQEINQEIRSQAQSDPDDARPVLEHVANQIEAVHLPRRPQSDIIPPSASGEHSQDSILLPKQVQNQRPHRHEQRQTAQALGPHDQTAC